MPKLKEYLGGLVSSLAQGRVLADLQTVNIAKAYASDPLLKHFAIPRMRIEDVEITVPFALESTTRSQRRIFQGLDSAAFNQRSFELVTAAIGVTEITGDVERQLRGEIVEKALTMEQELYRTDDQEPLNSYVSALLISFAQTAEKAKLLRPAATKKLNLAELQTKIVEDLKDRLRYRIDDAELMDLEVVAESSKLQEQKPSNLIVIKMKISESGMEWHQIEGPDGKTESKLLPE